MSGTTPPLPSPPSGREARFSGRVQRLATRLASLLLLGSALLGMPDVPSPALAASLIPAATAADVQEYELKAAFLYNFAVFTEWPPGWTAGGGKTLTICVLGEDPFGPALKVLESKSVEGKKVSVRPIGKPEQADTCHILFVSASEQPRLPKVLEALQGMSVLTVSDMEDAAKGGIMIGLLLDGRRVVFDINHTAAKRAQLTLSSKLLRLARALY